MQLRVEIRASGIPIHNQKFRPYRLLTQLAHRSGKVCDRPRAIRGFEAMLWLRKGFGFAGAWTVCEQNRMLSVCFGLPAVNKA
jgi:hypothetical protein